MAATTRPNILLIVADDFRADAIHALGNDAVQTPNLDGLVKKGSIFSQETLSEILKNFFDRFPLAPPISKTLPISLLLINSKNIP